MVEFARLTVVVGAFFAAVYLSLALSALVGGLLVGALHRGPSPPLRSWAWWAVLAGIAVGMLTAIVGFTVAGAAGRTVDGFALEVACWSAAVVAGAVTRSVVERRAADLA